MDRFREKSPSEFNTLAGKLSGLPGVQIAAWLTAFAAAAGCTYLAAPFLMAGSQRYPDFIAGLLAFADYYKSGELRVVLALPLLFFIFYPLVWRILSRLFRGVEAPAARGFTARDVLFICAGLLAARYFIYAEIGPGLWAACAVVAAAAAAEIFNPRLRLLPAVIFGPLWGFLSSLAIFAACFSLGTPQETTIAHVLNWSLYAGAAAGLASLVITAVRPRILAPFLLLLQLPLPLLLLRFYRIQFYHHSAAIPLVMSSFGRFAIFAFIIFLSALTLKALASSLNKETGVETNSISLGSIVALGCFVSFGLPPASPFQADDFHLGEMMLPWQQIMELGQRSFDQFVSIQGYLALTIGFVNNLFFEGSVFTYYSASIFTGGIVSGLSAYLAARLLGPGAALALTPFLLATSNRFFLVPPALLILCHPKLLARPAAWCAASILIAWGCILWNAASGVALSVALFLPGIYQLWRILKAPRRDRTAGLVLGAAALAFVLFFTPFRGVIQFILENGSTSLIAHGNPLFMTMDSTTGLAHHFKSGWANRMVFEGVRVGGWVLVILILFAAFFSALRRRLTPETLGLICLSGGYIIFSLVLLPQSMGRIDSPPYMSRTGAHALLALGFFAPVAFAYAKRWLAQAVMPGLVAGFLCGVPLALRNDTPDSLATLAALQITVPAQFEYYDGSDKRLPGLSRIFLPPGKLPEMFRFHEAVANFTRPGESYVDFANRAVYHFLFGLRYPAPYPYVHAVNRAIQDRLIRTFEAEKPAVIWLSPSFEIDRGPPSLRAYRTWKWLMLNGYRYVNYQSYGFLLRADRFAEKFPGPQHDVVTEALVGDSFRPALDGLPLAWGKSYESLRDLVEEIPLKVTVVDRTGMLDGKEGFDYPRLQGASLTFEVEKPLAGRDADYLLLEIESKGGANPRTWLGLSWNSGKGTFNDEEKTFRFRAAPGIVIVPVGNDPRWLLGDGISRLRVYFLGKKGLSWKVSRISALRLR